MITKYPVTPTLVLSQRYTADSIQMWRTAMRRGWDSVRASVGYARQLSVSCPLVYHESGPQVAEALGVTLISPPADWLPSLPFKYAMRDIRLCPASVARANGGSVFIKPPTEKSFQARVYNPGELPGWVDQLVLVSEPVEFVSEYRSFILDGVIPGLSRPRGS